MNSDFWAQSYNYFISVAFFGLEYIFTEVINCLSPNTANPQHCDTLNCQKQALLSQLQSCLQCVCPRPFFSDFINKLPL